VKNGDINHGTYGGYQAHRRHGEEVCEACRIANNTYRREYRNSKPDASSYDRTQAAAYRRAENRLRRLHYPEFNQLYHEELVRAGLRPDAEEAS